MYGIRALKSCRARIPARILRSGPTPDPWAKLPARGLPYQARLALGTLWLLPVNELASGSWKRDGSNLQPSR
jgi:hypothetical protein